MVKNLIWESVFNSIWTRFKLCVKLLELKRTVWNIHITSHLNKGKILQWGYNTCHAKGGNNFRAAIKWKLVERWPREKAVKTADGRIAVITWEFGSNRIRGKYPGPWLLEDSDSEGLELFQSFEAIW